MRVIAVYNMKGGVGKTTAAVNLAYCSAAGGARTLVWDLDPQAAASFSFRVRPHVDGVRRKTVASGDAFAMAIKETDYANLDLLPADFAYRKLDRLLGEIGKPARVVTTLVDAVGRDYDTVFLDCPAGLTLLTEGLFAAADLLLVPTIPTVLSLRTVARVIKSADRCDSPADIAAFLSMVDRRKTLHRRASEAAAAHQDLFIPGQIPYASVVEQMTVRRMPLPVFAPRDPATLAFREIWAQVQARLRQRPLADQPKAWGARRQIIESLVDGLELSETPATRHPDAPAVAKVDAMPQQAPNGAAPEIVHRFDTDGRDLERLGCIVELRERGGGFSVVTRPIGSSDDSMNAPGSGLVQIDRVWAMQILSGALSPLTALERRLGWSPHLFPAGRGRGELTLRRIESRLAHSTEACCP
jgi:chromosome partitioning protein